MKQLCIIPCGTKKIWDKYGDVGPTPAKEAYIGTFHNLCEQYATRFCDEWVILSAKHGFLLPSDMVEENYDVTFNTKSDQIISMEQLQKQVDQKKLNQYDTVVVLTGKKYVPIVKGSFEIEKNIQFPLLRYSGIGYMQQALKRAVTTQQPLH
ncbi:DUF6884 domain-containing protein [Aquibacillus sediminis]|uniref:DUF6884 domain-containing protein n=1 Tax=Aquibacillus sediminis TaxID=2574734 RepID=UPI001107C81E|nr:DUF6884 domain-containing protein [Aquibacillus sediminis]